MAASKTEQEKIRDEALRRMLNTPHKPHAKPKKKPKKKGSGAVADPALSNRAASRSK
jgi:hypothetical protein